MIEKSVEFEEDVPLTLPLSMLTKQYIGVMFKKLAHVGIEKYYTAMVIIEKAGGRLTQQNLADQLHVDKATVVRIVDYLVERDFVNRQQNPDDRREYFMVLTERAQQAMCEICATISHLNELVFAAFTEEEKKQFWQAIRRINNTLATLPADEVLFDYDPKKHAAKPNGNEYNRIKQPKSSKSRKPSHE